MTITMHAKDMPTLAVYEPWVRAHPPNPLISNRLLAALGREPESTLDNARWTPKPDHGVAHLVSTANIK